MNPVRYYLNTFDLIRNELSEAEKRAWWDFMLDDFCDWEDGYSPDIQPYYETTPTDLVQMLRQYMDFNGEGRTWKVEKSEDVLTFLHKLADSIDYWWQVANNQGGDPWFDFIKPDRMLDDSRGHWPVRARLADGTTFDFMPVN